MTNHKIEKKTEKQFPMLRIGLTGGIGSGKSTVSDYLTEKGLMVLDADRLSRELVEPGQPLLKEVEQNFGPGVIKADGTLDRKALGEIVFDDENARQRLNNLFHGRIIEEIALAADRLERAGERAVFIDAALLFEAGMEKMVDEVWLVDLTLDEQIKRVIARDGSSPDEVRRKISSQMSSDEKRARADVILDNNGTPEQLIEQVDRLLKRRLGNQKSKLMRLPILLLTLLLSISFIGCGKQGVTETDPATSSPPAAAVKSDLVSLPIERFQTLNPIVSKDEGVYYLNQLVYQGLFRLDRNLGANSVLAADYSYNDDGQSVEISLKKDIKWQNGKSLTAEDVKFSIEAYQAAAAGPGTLYEPYIAKIESVQVKNKTAVIIKFKSQTDAAIENLTFPIVSKRSFASTAATLVTGHNYLPVGTGPYLVESIDPGKQVNLAPNPHFQGEIPKNNLIFRILPDKKIAAGLFEIGDLNVGLLKESDRDARFNGKPVRIESFTANEVEVLGFNFRNEALKNLNVRRAVAQAIDDQRLLEGCYYNSAISNDTLFYPEYLGIGKAEALLPYDIDQAKITFQQSGLSGLNLKLIYNKDDTSRMLAARQLQDDLGMVGISVTLAGLDWAAYTGALERGEFDLYIGGYRILDTYDLRPLLASNRNLLGYSNPVLDSLLDRLHSGVTTKVKKETYTEIRKLLRTEIPYYCLAYKTYGLVVSENLTGNVKPFLQNIYNNCETFRLTEAEK
ncbi:MAG TPA: dephospho-CoA kinase [Clostridiales bacterium]|nr:dephospho-CoA kinase [Clostridiales bacterium]